MSWRDELAQTARELRAGRHPDFDLCSLSDCIGGITHRRIKSQHQSLTEMAASWSRDPTEYRQILVLFHMEHDPNECQVDRYDASAAADRIDRFLETGKVWP